ncbi:MAG: enoyl-CoA hydratase [Mesorhizobium amorphae]|nr:MAG: enoyl-CoA hydratase [Mesorhizobium amorphae]
MTELVETETRNGVRLIALNRPEVRNALSVPLLLALRKAVRAAAEDDAVRALVLTGRGGAFSGGADVKEWADKTAGIDPYPDHDWTDEAVRLVQEVFSLRKPTIAMIDGPAVGGGLDMALACDFRIVSNRARFICAYTRIAYPPDCGGSWLMPRLMGVEAAKLFAFTGDAWDADTALAHKLVSRVVPEAELESETWAFAEKLASGPTVAIGHAKALIDSWSSRGFADQLIEEIRAGKLCAETEDHKEALAASTERRKPVFTGR